MTAVAAAVLPATRPEGPVSGAGQQAVQDPGDRGLIGVVLPAGGEDLPGMPPGEVREGR